MSSAPGQLPDWADTGPEEVAAGVYRIPLPLPGDGLRAVNAYLLQGDPGDLLVDCGWARDQSWQVLEAALAGLGRPLEGVRQVFATHFHADHLGAAGRVRERSRALVSLGLGDRQSALTMALEPERARERTLARLRQHGGAEVALALERSDPQGAEPEARPPLPDLFLVGGELLAVGAYRFEVLATPGHTRGHLCLFDPEQGLLLAGDHVLPRISPSVGVEVPGQGLPLRDFLESLARVRGLPAQLVLPAHGPTFTDLAGRVDQLLQHHRERLELCRELVEGGRRTAAAVAAGLPWTRRQRRLDQLDPFNQLLAVSETVAHLELLVARGQLSRRLSESGVEFAPPTERAAEEALP
ncbi:MAG: MBL fold metallo-hydrolase [Candidatus Dormibacteria bacterium]